MGIDLDNRYLVFQALPHTVGARPELWRVLAKCHDLRNLAEYEQHLPPTKLKQRIVPF